MKKKHKIKSVQDIKHCEEKCLTIYSKTEDCFYEFYNGIWCRYDKKGHIRVYNATLYFDTELYYYEEQEQQEAIEKDIGKLCWFFDKGTFKVVGILEEVLSMDDNFPFRSDYGIPSKYCRPLTKEEIKEFMEKAE